jgi:hypothetical protein
MQSDIEMMLIPIQYHKRKYPAHIIPCIDEIAGHFDVHEVLANCDFSLHTEYSYGKRNLNSDLMKKFKTLQSSHKEGVPRLWYSEQWAVEFADFVKTLCNGKTPTIIEIHPPFSDYTETIEQFLRIYKIFEESILTSFSQTKILIENRSGSIYKGGIFLISRGQHLRSLCEQISSKNLKLRITLDIPQLLTSYGGAQRLEAQEIKKILNRQNALQSMTDGIHLWGKMINGTGRTISHCGDLNTYFENEEKKNIFLEWLADFLRDNKPRYFVPEVNSSDEDLHSIIKDIEGMNIKFN